jgi:hypothetical protein
LPSPVVTVVTLFIEAVFLSPIKINLKPEETTIRGSSGSGSSGTVAQSRSPKEPCQTCPKALVTTKLEALSQSGFIVIHVTCSFVIIWL